MNDIISPGAIFKHYKGQLYEIICVAKDNETLEMRVVYRQLYGDFTYWIRTYKDFTGNVEFNKKTVPRFYRFS